MSLRLRIIHIKHKKVWIFVCWDSQGWRPLQLELSNAIIGQLVKEEGRYAQQRPVMLYGSPTGLHSPAAPSAVIHARMDEACDLRSRHENHTPRWSAKVWLVVVVVKRFVERLGRLDPEMRGFG